MTETKHHRNDELADWIRAIGRWKSQQRKLKNLLVGIEELLREREEVMEEALWLRATARNKEEYEKADEALSRSVAMAQEDHEETVQRLQDIHDRLEGTELEGLFERPRNLSQPASENPVDEASRESFPASDPPSFNPGRA